MKHLFLAILLVATSHSLIAGDATAGKNKSMVCSSCHGAEGVSIAPNWPNLAGQHAKYLEKQLAEFRSGDRKDPQMGAFAMNLSDQDIADLSAYFASQETPSGSVKEEFLALGEEIYNRGTEGVMACTGCHGPNANGLDSAGFPGLSGQKVDYTIKQLKDFRAGARNNDMNGMMRNIAKAMTDEQIEAVANFIAGLY